MQICFLGGKKKLFSLRLELHCVAKNIVFWIFLPYHDSKESRLLSEGSDLCCVGCLRWRLWKQCDY